MDRALLGHELRAIRTSLLALARNIEGGYIGMAAEQAEAAAIRDRLAAFVDKLRGVADA